MLFNDEPGQNHGKDYWTKVKYNTVGQCTSLRDKNGRDIYEGDIIKAGNENDLLEVRFVRGVFAFLWNGDLDSEFPCNAPTQEWAEIVGNIHDNPSMIKKSAWSEEDDKMVKDIIAAIDTLHYHEMVDWLKSLKERVQPQYLTITNEELVQAKKEAYNDALNKIEYHSDTPTFNDGWSAAIWYLKKRTTQPQSTWKPSEEQMSSLRGVVNSLPHQQVLFTLYNDLRKLKGE